MEWLSAAGQWGAGSPYSLLLNCRRIMGSGLIRLIRTWPVSPQPARLHQLLPSLHIELTDVAVLASIQPGIAPK